MILKCIAKVLTNENEFRTINRIIEIKDAILTDSTDEKEQAKINKQKVLNAQTDYCDGIRKFNSIAVNNLIKGEILTGINTELLSNFNSEDIILIK